MKKVIWIHTISYRPNSDAPANRIYAFAKFFSKNNFKVNIITIGTHDSVEEREEATIYYLKNNFHYKKRTFINRLFSNLSFFYKTKKIIKSHKKEIYDTFFMVSIPEYISGSACLLAKNMCYKFIVDVRDIWPEVAIEMGAFRPKSFKTKIFKHIANKLYSSCDYLITVSKGKTKHLMEITNHEKDNKIFWIGNGFDLDTYTLENDFSKLCKYNINLKDKFVVSYIGNIGKAQNLINLLEFAKTKQNSDYLFIIGGTGVELESLKKYANNFNLGNVIFTGKLTKEQSKALTLRTHVSFIPLLSDNMTDSVPTKLFDSLGLGIPVFLIANGESTHILNECKLGLSIKPSEIDKLENTFKFFKKNYKKISKNSEYAKEIIKTKYSRQKYCKDLMELLIG